MFPNAKLIDENWLVSCGDTDAIKPATGGDPETRNPLSSPCCVEVVQIQPGRLYFGSGVFHAAATGGSSNSSEPESSAAKQAAGEAAASLRSLAYAHCGITEEPAPGCAGAAAAGGAELELEKMKKKKKKAKKVAHLWRHQRKNSGGEAFYRSMARLQGALESKGVEFEARSTRSGQSLCDQVRLDAVPPGHVLTCPIPPRSVNFVACYVLCALPPGSWLLPPAS
jgi:hypothetical protein